MIRSSAALVVLSAVLASGLPAAGCACPGAGEKSVKAAGTRVALDPGHYAETEHDGRFYVFGDPKTEEAFAKSPHMQLSKTFVAAGPDGKSVVFEAKADAPMLTSRLIRTFEARHGVTLR